MSETYNPDTHRVVKHTHFRAFIIGALVLLAAVGGIMYSFGGRLDTENGRLAITWPDFNPIKDRIVVKTAEGPVVAQVQLPAPNGQTTKTSDGFGLDGRLQRDVNNHDRYDPFDRLGNQMGDLAKAVKTGFEMSAKQIVATNESVKAIGDRVTKLESAQVTPAPAPAPQAQPAPSAQAVAPVVPMANEHSAAMTQTETEFFVPKGFHLNGGMDKPRNLARMKTCQAPHRLEIDRSSPKCHAAGYNDPNSGIPVRSCPNKCV